MRRFLLLLALLVALALGVWLALRAPELPPVPRVVLENTNELGGPTTDHSAPLEHEVDPRPTAQPSTTAARDPIATIPRARTTPDEPCKLHGTVRMLGAPTPLAGVRLALMYSMPGPVDSPTVSSESTSNRRREQTSGNDGRFAFSVPRHAHLISLEIKPRTVRSSLYAPIDLGFFLDKVIDFGLHELDVDEEYDFVVLPPPTLQIHVLDDQTSSPVANAHVAIRGACLATSQLTDDHGNFECLLLDPESFLHDSRSTAEVTASGFLPQRRPVPQVRNDGSIPDMTFRLEPGTIVSGTVVAGTDGAARGVKLLLLPWLASHAGAQHELAGIYSTNSMQGGAFRFEGIPRFEKAWLVVPTQQRDAVVWYGERRMPLETSTGSLAEIRVQLDLEMSVAVNARFPDGTVADRTELELLRAEIGGKPWVPARSTFLPVPCGRPVRVIARGWIRSLGARSPGYFAETTQTFTLDLVTPASLSLTLRPDPDYVSPESGGGENGTAPTWPGWNQQKLTVKASAAGGEALKGSFVRGEGLEEADPLSAIETGVHRYPCSPGWHYLEIGADGHRSRFFEVLIEDREPHLLDLTLDRPR